jgi:hypothetical protein
MKSDAAESVWHKGPPHPPDVQTAITAKRTSLDDSALPRRPKGNHVVGLRLERGSSGRRAQAGLGKLTANRIFEDSYRELLNFKSPRQ